MNTHAQFPADVAPGLNSAFPKRQLTTKQSRALLRAKTLKSPLLVAKQCVFGFTFSDSLCNDNLNHHDEPCGHRSAACAFSAQKLQKYSGWAQILLLPALSFCLGPIADARDIQRAFALESRSFEVNLRDRDSDIMRPATLGRAFDDVVKFKTKLISGSKMQCAIVIGLEEYADEQIEGVKFAAADAKAFSDVLSLHGLADDARIVLVNEAATRTTIESRVRRTLKSLDPEDTLYLYFAGRGFSLNGKSYVACHDTQLDDLAATSISIESILKQKEQSDCERVVVFLDACLSKKFARAAADEIDAEFDHGELNEFFESTEKSLCFASCDTNEESWSSGKIKHGIWAYHLIEAFADKAPAALVKKTLLTGASLQNYLKKSVARTLRDTFTEKKSQTPLLFGADQDSVLVDFAQSSIRDESEDDQSKQQMLRMSILGNKAVSIRSLTGFLKGQKLPDKKNSYADSLVAKLAEQDIKDEVATVHEHLRTAFKFKRLDTKIDEPIEGGGLIKTPYFDYSVDVSLSPEDVSEVTWQRVITNIKEPKQILSPAFGRVFERMFDTIEFSAPKTIDVAQVIDKIENLESELITVKYDHTVKWCKVAVESVPGELHVTKSSLKFVTNKTDNPQRLLESFFEVQSVLAEDHDVRLLDLK